MRWPPGMGLQEMTVHRSLIAPHPEGKTLGAVLQRLDIPVSEFTTINYYRLNRVLVHDQHERVHFVQQEYKKTLDKGREKEQSMTSRASDEWLDEVKPAKVGLRSRGKGQEGCFILFKI